MLQKKLQNKNNNLNFKNNDGYIVKSEFMKVMKKHGEKITSKEIDSMIKQCDVDKDGKINYTGQ